MRPEHAYTLGVAMTEDVQSHFDYRTYRNVGFSNSRSVGNKEN